MEESKDKEGRIAGFTDTFHLFKEIGNFCLDRKAFRDWTKGILDSLNPNSHGEEGGGGGFRPTIQSSSNCYHGKSAGFIKFFDFS